jgi:hypothetical protein
MSDELHDAAALPLIHFVEDLASSGRLDPLEKKETELSLVFENKGTIFKLIPFVTSGTYMSHLQRVFSSPLG